MKSFLKPTKMRSFIFVFFLLFGAAKLSSAETKEFSRELEQLNSQLAQLDQSVLSQEIIDMMHNLSLSKSCQLSPEQLIKLHDALAKKHLLEPANTKKTIIKTIAASIIVICISLTAVLIYYKIQQEKEQPRLPDHPLEMTQAITNEMTTQVTDRIKEAGGNIGKAVYEKLSPEKSSIPDAVTALALPTIQYNVEQIGPNPTPVTYCKQARHWTMNKTIRLSLKSNPPLAHLLTDPADAIKNFDSEGWVNVLKQKLAE